MAAPRNILVYARTVWYDTYAKTIIELTKQLAEKHRVLYLDYQFTLKDLLTRLFKGDKRPTAGQILGFKSRLQVLQSGGRGVLYLYTPPPIIPVQALPEGWLYRQLQAWNTRLVNRGLRRALRKLSMEQELILFNSFNPEFGQFYQGAFAEARHIYHCYDVIEAAPWLSRHGGPAEHRYLPEVDAAIFTSHGLFEQKGGLSPQAFVVENGVDYPRYRAAFTPPPGQGIVGYVGAVDFRTDKELLKAVIETCTHFQFEFVGPVKDAGMRSFLEEHPRVKWHGLHPASDLPGFLARWDAGIIPFLDNEFTAGVYPLKVNEYLAVGLPVVSTPFGQMSRFADIVHLADEAQKYSKELKAAVAEDTLEKRKIRSSFARQNSWEARARAVEKIIC